MDIELCIYYNIVTIWFLFMIQSVNLPPSAHTITSSTHCSILQPSAAYSQISSAHCNPLQPTAKHPVHTAAAITSLMHTLQQPLHLQCTHCSSHYIFSAHSSHVQLSAANLQCTLQPTAAIYNHLHYSYTIQCTLQLHYLMPIPYSASSEEG